jgi:UDP-glucose 4-epimerase
MTKCIIIGGNGFIGSEVAPLLDRADRNVHVLGRSPRPSLPLPFRMTYHQADYGDRETLRSLLEPGCEVINLAYSTVPKTSYDDPLHDLLSNLPANVALLEECQAAKIGKLVMVSSGGTVYGSAISLPIREDAVTLPVSPYGISKLSTDLYTLMLQRNTGLPAVVVRPANAYGESQLSGKGQGFIAEAIDAVLEKREIGIYGEQGTIRDYIHVSDVARGIVAALDHGNAGAVYNIGTGRGTSNLEIIEILRQLASSEKMEVRHQIRAARIFDVEANVLDSESLQRISGWKPRIPVDEGIRRVWESRLSGRGV